MQGVISVSIGGVILPKGHANAPPPLMWSVAGTTEADEGDPASYTVSYSGGMLAPGQVATITVASADGTADAASDYTALSTVLTFTGGGATSKTVAVSTIDDTDVEGTEDFVVSLAGQSIGTLGTSQVETEIVDDDELPAGIQFVGSVSGSNIDGGNVTLDLMDLSGGIGTAAIEGDLVLLLFGGPRGASDPGIGSAGYTFQGGGGGSLRTYVYTKVMTSTPDTSVIANGTANAEDVTAANARVYRGVHTDVLDAVLAAPASGSSGAPDSASVTTVTDGARVVTAAMVRHLGVSHDSDVTAPTGYGNNAHAGADDTRTMVVASADKTVAVAGAEDPGAWSDWVTTGGSLYGWHAYTIALKPA